MKVTIQIQMCKMSFCFVSFFAWNRFDVTKCNNAWGNQKKKNLLEEIYDHL